MEGQIHMSQWWGFIGIGIEIIGFIILAIDLLPEYWLNQTKELAKLFKSLSENPKWFESQAQGYERTRSDPQLSVLYDVQTLVHMPDFPALLRKLNIKRTLIRPPNLEQYKLIVPEIEQAIQAAEIKLQSRNRPPISWALFLAFLGMVLQMVGGWPTASVSQ